MLALQSHPSKSVRALIDAYNNHIDKGNNFEIRITAMFDWSIGIKRVRVLESNRVDMQGVNIPCLCYAHNGKMFKFDHIVRLHSYQLTSTLF